MRFKSIKIGKTSEKSEKETVREDTATLIKVAGMEEYMASNTKKLKNAEKRLRGLTDFAKVPKEDESEIPGPHGPLIELTVEPGDDITDLETEAELNTITATEEYDSEQDIKVVKLDNKNTVKAVGEMADKSSDKYKKNDKSEQGNGTKPDKNTEPVKASQDINDVFNNLFSDEEAEVNPHASLIGSLPEVSVEELINELEEIKEIIRERQQG